MAIESTCGGCGKLLSVGDEHAGRRARCPECGQIYTVPTPTGPNTPLAPTPPSPTSADATQHFPQTPVSTPISQQFGGPPAPPPTPLPPTSLPQNPPAPLAPSNFDAYWMRTPDGVEYGPADRATLDRWFREGRVGPGYMIRQSETGIWQPAEGFRSGPQAFTAPMMPSGGGNPYAATVGGPSAAAMNYPRYPKPDQSGLVLAFGILSWFVCPIFGIVAWVMGRSALADIAAGLSDPANKGMLMFGYYLGMICVILYSLCIGGYIVFAALAITLG